MTVQAYRGLTRVPEPFLRLLDEDEASDIFLSRAFYENFERNGMLPGSELQAFTVGDSSGPLGIAVGIRPSGPVGFLRADAVHFAHPDQIPFRAYTHPQRGSAADLVDRLADALGQGEERTDIVKFGAFDRKEAIYRDILKALRRHGFLTQSYFLYGNWYAEIGGRSADEYMTERPSKLRNTVRRRAKRLEKEAVGQFQLVRGGDQLTPAISDYVRVLVASWQGRHPMPRDYILGLLDISAAVDALRLGLYYVDGQPAAGQIWLVSEGTAHCYRLAFDPRFGRYSVGTLLTYEMFRYVIDVDKVERIDFGIGDDPFKKDWVSRRREYWGIAGFNKRTLAGLRTAITAYGITSAKRALIRLGIWRQPQA